MSANAVYAGGSVLSFVDLILIGGLYVTTNRRLNSLEKSSGVTLGSTRVSTVSSENAPKGSLESRILDLEKTNEILLHSIRCHEDILSKVLNRFREIESNPMMPILATADTRSSPSVSTSLRMTRIRKRQGDSLLAKKEPFTDADSSTKSEEDDIDEEKFSFLRD